MGGEAILTHENNEGTSVALGSKENFLDGHGRRPSQLPGRTPSNDTFFNGKTELILFLLGLWNKIG